LITKIVLSSLIISAFCAGIPVPWNIVCFIPLIGCIWGASYLWNEHKEYEGIVNNIQEDYFYKLDHLFDDSFTLDHCFDNTSELVMI
jgi:hypothetical protein